MSNCEVPTVQNSSFLIPCSLFLAFSGWGPVSSRGCRITKSLPIQHSTFIIHHSSFIIHHSSFIIHHSSFIIHHSSMKRGHLVETAPFLSFVNSKFIYWQLYGIGSIDPSTTPPALADHAPVISSLVAGQLNWRVNLK